MRGAFVVCFAILGVAVAARYGAAKETRAAKENVIHACSLLSADDIAGVTGAKVGEGRETSTVITSGPEKGETMATCTWRVGEQGMANVHVIPAPAGGARDASLTSIRQVVDKLKSQGWKEEKQAFGAVVCSTMTPPAAQRGMPIAVGCMGEAKGMGVGVNAMSPGIVAPLPKMKALFDKATSRLP